MSDATQGEGIGLPDKPSESSKGRSSPRLWPAVFLVAAYWVFELWVRMTKPDGIPIFFVNLLGPLITGLLLLIYWVTFSRTSRLERLLLPAVFILSFAAAVALGERKGAIGLVLQALPLALAIAVGTRVWAHVTRSGIPLLMTSIAIMFSWAFFLTIRFEQSDGSVTLRRQWRWIPTAEESFLAKRAEQGTTEGAESNLSSEIVIGPSDWPGFRGKHRDGIVYGSKIETDWKTKPPRELWRQLVGPAWSSMAIADGLLFTQEQAGEDECVVGYAADTGKEIWRSRAKSRHEDPPAGAGPRATPALVGNQVIAVGGAGLVRCLHARSGEPVWERNLAEDAPGANSLWGFSSSPCVVGDVVAIGAGGTGEVPLAIGYDLSSGKVLWKHGKSAEIYASIQAATIDGRELFLVTSNDGLDALDPKSGELLWRHEWVAKGARNLQPKLLEGNRILLLAGDNMGAHLFRVIPNKSPVQAEVEWESKAIKPESNDGVVFDGHLYGFDDAIFCCLDLENGKRKWKKGRYEKGQVLLLADQGLLIVISERGAVVLLRANPEKHEELGSFQALDEQAITWNHPVLVGNKLYLRNAKEMCCYDVGGN